MIEVVTPSLPIASIAPAPKPEKGHREPPKTIQLLLPVWGVKYIAQFLQVSLPTLIAPGNLPSIAGTLPSKFVFLTDTDGVDVLSEHPAVQHLRGLCEVDFMNIDDLITGDNYSTTITLAYARAVRMTGDEMTETCFFFLISDYIMADGSLANVLARVQAGNSGVVAGNFQVTEEDALDSFFSTFDAGDEAIVPSARNLMSWAIRFLHPMTLANTVNFPLCHSVHSNRLFWYVDASTLIGRFYLMHMICIRPEVTNFQVGSSCDYSFIPEMCPSGNVHVMTDSDEYLVVEMQPQNHERNFVRLGAVVRDNLVESLSEWTTATHRKNAHSTVVYHALELPSKLGAVIVEASAYIDGIESSLPPPQPHHNHPYWLGAIAAHLSAVARRDGKAASQRMTNVSRLQESILGWRTSVFGRPPNVRPWHPRFPDYRMLMDLARKYFAEQKGRLLIASSTAVMLRDLLGELSQSVDSLDIGELRRSKQIGQQRNPLGSYDGCLLVLKEDEILALKPLISAIKPLLAEGKYLLIFAINGHELSVGTQFSDDLLRQIPKLFDPALSLDEVHFLRAGKLTWTALRGMRHAMVLTLENVLWFPLAALMVVLLIGICFLGNLRRYGTRQPAHNQLCSSVGLIMRSAAAVPSAVQEPIKASPLDLAGRRFRKDRVRLVGAVPAAPA
jgi:hypothetical protein